MPGMSAIDSPFAHDPRRRARALYWQGWAMAQIADELHLPKPTVRSWKRRDKWDESPAIERVETSIEARLTQLVIKDPKTGSDYKEIDLLGRQIERLARVRRYQQPGGHEGDLNPNIEARNAGPKKAPTKNFFSDEEIARLRESFAGALFGYQQQWQQHGQVERIRNVLKSRQIGATWYFAREAFIDALTTGRNQIFLSASKAQAQVFKHYILQFVREECDRELRGDPIVLPNGATLYFLGTNTRTAQSYHGNLYLDEYFWIPRFLEFRKVASGMAIHKQWRQTYISTPSSVTHEAYSFWSGALYNRGRKKEQRVEIDISHRALAGGVRCADGQHRQIVTVEDAVAGGCNLFDLDQLRREYSPEEYANLLMCEFIDDTASVFPLATMMRCMVDSLEEWADVKPYSVRPFGGREVWLGYDPSLSGDAAAAVVVAPPAVAGGKFRILERKQWRGMDFADQAAGIQKLCQRYHVSYIAIDSTGMGQGVYQLVKQSRPDAVELRYTADTKVRMVLKALDVISRGRLEFDAGWTDIAQAFMSIRRAPTPSGQHVTFEASRSEEVSHADLAWATMHALINEPLEGNTASNRSFMEIH